MIRGVTVADAAKAAETKNIQSTGQADDTGQTRETRNRSLQEDTSCFSTQRVKMSQLSPSRLVLVILGKVGPPYHYDVNLVTFGRDSKINTKIYEYDILYNWAGAGEI